MKKKCKPGEKGESKAYEKKEEALMKKFAPKMKKGKK